MVNRRNNRSARGISIVMGMGADRLRNTIDIPHLNGFEPASQTCGYPAQQLPIEHSMLA